MSDRIESFEKFWPFYVREHSKAATRALHFVGLTGAGLIVATALATKRYKLLPLALLSGYGPAWVSHFFIEKNRPATFKYPLWSFMGDFKMWSKIATGKMQEEIDKANAEVAAAEPSAVDADRAAAPRRNGVVNTELN